MSAAAAFSPSVQTADLVSALSVYAAGRKSFDVIVRCNIEKHTALALIFSRLPLAEHGWEYEQTTIEYVGNRKLEWPKWRISRS